MKWIGERISFVDEPSKTTVVIHAKDIGWIKSAMGAWVAMWVAIGAIVTWAYFTFDINEQEAVAIIVFIGFWVYYAYKVIKSWAWFMWGKELIKIDEAAFYYKRSVLKYGKSRPYLLENISKIRLHHPEEKSFQAAWERSPWIVGGERLEFDYMGKVIKIGRKLEARDAELLFKLLTKRVDMQIRKNRKSAAKIEE